MHNHAETANGTVRLSAKLRRSKRADSARSGQSKEIAMTNKLYAFVGPHASGKSTLIKELIKLGVHYVPLYTTRTPEAVPRNLDSDPELYRFLDKIDFFKQDFLVKTTYKGDYFGLLKKDILDSIQQYPNSVVIMDAQSLNQLAKLLKDSFESIYIMVDYVTLVERMLRMNHTNDEIKQHIEYAENNGEFDTWKTATYVVKNVISPDAALRQILAILGLAVPITDQHVNSLTGTMQS